MKAVRTIIFGLALLVSFPLTGSSAQQNRPTEVEVRGLLQQAVEKEKRAPGIVAGMVDEQGQQVFACGTLKRGGSDKVDADTLFEIGSITKVFTTLLLQEMVDHGEVRLDDPIGKFLPASVKTPSRQGKQITLYHLATHTSGLPRLPFSTWHLIWHMDDPYAPFKVKDFYKFLSGYKLTRDIGAKVEYSNAGMELLGHLLALKAGTNYESLVVQRLCRPLGMDSTCITLAPELQRRFASGHDEDGAPVANWSPSDFPADGALRSSANDLLKFLAANLGFTRSGLSNAMQQTRLPRHAFDGMPGEFIGLGWIINTNAHVIWHDGGTQGYRSYIGFNPFERRGVVVLANSDKEIDDLGELLIGVRKFHRVTPINPKVYSRYIGKYRCDAKRLLTVTRRGDQLFIQVTGQSAFEIFPEAETQFFCREVDAEVRFVSDEAGTTTELVLHQHGRDFKMPRLIVSPSHTR